MRYQLRELDVSSSPISLIGWVEPWASFKIEGCMRRFLMCVVGFFGEFSTDFLFTAVGRVEFFGFLFGFGRVLLR